MALLQYRDQLIADVVMGKRDVRQEMIASGADVDQYESDIAESDDDNALGSDGYTPEESDDALAEIEE